MATNLYIDVADKLAVNGLSDPNPLRPPDISPPGSYLFNLYFLDYASPFTYHRYSGAQIALNVRMDGPPDNATFTLGTGADTTPAIDINSNNGTILGQLQQLRGIGVGNVKISGNRISGWIFEFVGARSGKSQPLLSVAMVSSTPASNISVQRIQTGSSTGNEKQIVRILQSSVATIGSFTEIGVPTTPGWLTGGSGLSTAAISTNFWLSPEYDVILEAILNLAATRSGADGVITSVVDRNGTDGVISDDGRGRSGTDGAVVPSAGRVLSNMVVYSSNAGGNMQATAGSLYGIPVKEIVSSGGVSNVFLQSDVGRTISATHIPAGSTIIAVNTGGTWPGGFARISPPVTDTTANQFWSESVTLGTAPISTTYQSSSGNFTQADVGHAFSGTNIPANTTILSVTDTTHVILSNLPTAAGTLLSWTITAGISNKYQSASAVFTSADIGRSFTGTNIPLSTVVLSFIDASNITLSNTPTATGTGLTWDMPAVISNTYQSASAAFTSTDVGQNFNGTNIPVNTTILSVTDTTHCVLSNTPTAVGTTLSWTIQYTGSGAAGAPVVTRVQAGSGTQPEIQKITFSRQLLYGSFNLQDGGGGSNPLATIGAPLTAAAVQAGLNQAYPSYGSVTVTQTAPTVVQIKWGVNASQTLLLVDDTNAIYDPQVMRLVLVPAFVQILPGIGPGPSAHVQSIFIVGDISQPTPISQPLVTSLNDGTKAFTVRQRFMQLAANFSKQDYNSGGPMGTYLVNEENMQDRHGIIFWDRVWASLPANRTETHQQMRPCIGIARTFLNGFLIDIQLFSLSISTWCNVNFSYSLGIGGLGIPQDGPAGTVLHFQGGGLGVSQLLAYNGFSSVSGTFYQQFVQSWSRRRWMGDIWEQAVYIN